MTNYLVTGASRGIGLGLVSLLISLPKSEVGIVVATTRSAPTASLQKLIDESSGRLVHVQIDPVDLDSVKAAASRVEEGLSGASLDIIVNNVGAMGYTPDGIITMTDLADAFNVNVLSAHHISSVLIPLLERGGQKKIINISTTLGSLNMASRFSLFPVPAYKVAKAALNMLTLQYAQEYGPKGFTIVALSPGWVKTDLGSEAADLTVEESVNAIVNAIHTAGPEVNGQLLNVHVKGWEENPGLNQYAGGIMPR